MNLLISEKVYFMPWSLFTKTESISDDVAVITVEAVVKNESEREFQGNCCFQITYSGKPVAETCRDIVIATDNSEKISVQIKIENPRLWKIEVPNLYKLTAMLQEDGRETDTETTNFGIRTIRADALNGLFLNEKPIKLKGGCVHHDCGVLGAAAYRDYEYRKVKIHKENGFNAIRCSHNPPSSHFLDACDLYGILVIDEAFDCWRMGKTLNDYSLFFEDWWERDLTSMIMRDRNHPSVIMWSIGNEIGERAGDSDGYKWAEKLSRHARGLDATRLITSGICAIWPTEEQEEELVSAVQEKTEVEVQTNVWEVNLDTPFSKKHWGEYTEKYAEVLDVVGYNYMEGRYEEDGICYPDRVICGTESFAQNIDRIWKIVETSPHVIGDFAWTSYDYIGEAGIGKAHYLEQGEMLPDHETAHDSPYPWRLAHDADFDICGFLTPQGAYRKIVWGSGETYIAVHNPENYGKQEVLSMWGWSDCGNYFTFPEYEGKPVMVSVYSKALEVELFHNGDSLGRKLTERVKAEYSLVYKPGELRAVSYDGDEIISEDAIKTIGMPYQLKITVEPENLPVQNQKLIFAVIEVADENGNTVRGYDRLVTVNVTGNLVLKGLGSANPQSEENYTETSFTSYEGRLLAVIAREDGQNGGDGSIQGNRIEVAADGILAAGINIG